MYTYGYLNFYCSCCKRRTDSGCYTCLHFTNTLLYRISLFEDLLFNSLKNDYDDCEDDDPIKVKVRLNMAASIDDCCSLFDDIFLYERISDSSQYADYYEIGKPELHFFYD